MLGVWKNNTSKGGEVMEIRFTIDLPDSLNVWMNKCWQAKMREKDQFFKDIYYLLCEQVGCPLPKFSKAKVKYTIYSSTLWDADNRITIAKIANDALKRAEIIPDDDPEHLEYGLPEFVVDKTQRVVLVELEVSDEGGLDRGR